MARIRDLPTSHVVQLRSNSPFLCVTTTAIHAVGDPRQESADFMYELRSWCPYTAT